MDAIEQPTVPPQLTVVHDRCPGLARNLTLHQALSMTIDGAGRSGADIDDHFSPAPEPPWFLGAAPAPRHESDGDSESAPEVAALPFLRTVQLLRDFVGDGCRLTKQGCLFAADRKRIDRMDMAADDQESRDGYGSYYGPHPRVELAWTVLTQHGWLLREDGWLRPTGKPLPLDDRATNPERDGLRRLTAEAVRSALAGRSGGAVDEDVLDGLLVASGPDGLIVPHHPRDGILAHCDETTGFLLSLIRHPHITEVPIDRWTGHVECEGMERLARFAENMDALVRCGLAAIDEQRDDLEGSFEYQDVYRSQFERRPWTTYRVPAAFRGAVAMLRAE